MSAPRVLVVGSANIDLTIAVPRLPAPGETVSEGTLLVNHGGKGANQAVAARRLGAETRLIACVGQDASGDGIRDALAREGLGTEGIAAVEEPTGTALIIVDAEGRNQIAVAPGANRSLTAAHVRARAGDFAWAEVVVCSLEVPLDAVGEALALARAHRAITILNPAPVPPRVLDCWSLIDYLTPNEGEAERLTSLSGVEAAGRALRDRGASTVVVTRGGDGLVAFAAPRMARLPAFRVAVVDTTAAGDAFNGALAVALAERGAAPVRRAAAPGSQAGTPSWDGLMDALRFASAAAALACTRRGAQDSLPTRVEVERLVQRAE